MREQRMSPNYEGFQIQMKMSEIEFNQFWISDVLTIMIDYDLVSTSTTTSLPHAPAFCSSVYDLDSVRTS